MLVKGIGVAFLALSLYYARFFVLRQEAITLVQLVALLCAAGWLLLSGVDRGRLERTRGSSGGGR